MGPDSSSYGRASQRNNCARWPDGLPSRMRRAAGRWCRQRSNGCASEAFYEHLGFKVTPRVVIGKWSK